MNKSKSIRVKAAFLITVFSLNTLIGFACAIGIDLGFYSDHHNDEVTTGVSIHTHTDGKKHIHHNEKAKQHHDEETADKSKNADQGCCSDKVIKFNEVDKSASHSLSPVTNPVFNSSFISSFYNNSIFFTSYTSSGTKYFVRNYHPPIPDIRVAIQSFQI